MNLRKKNMVMLAVGALLIVMAVGYAAAYTMLQISGTASMEATWNVAITGIDEGTPVGTAYNKSTPTYTGTTATFDVGFKDLGDSMTYSVTVTNNGTIDAIVNDISFTIYNNTLTFDEEKLYPYANVSYLIYGIKNGDVVRSSDSVTFNIRVDSQNFVPLYDRELEFSMNFLISLEQYTNQKYSQTYLLNDRVLLDDNAAWRVLQDSGDTVTLMREESISDELVFDENDDTNFETSTLKSYLNTTYKETLSQNMIDNIIGDITILDTSVLHSIALSPLDNKNCEYGRYANECNIFWISDPSVINYYNENNFKSKKLYMKTSNGGIVIDYYGLYGNSGSSTAISDLCNDDICLPVSIHPVITINKSAIR